MRLLGYMACKAWKLAPEAVVFSVPIRHTTESKETRAFAVRDELLQLSHSDSHAPTEVLGPCSFCKVGTLDCVVGVAELVSPHQEP